MKFGILAITKRPVVPLILKWGNFLNEIYEL